MIIKKNFRLFSILLIIALSFAIYSNSFFAAFQFDDGVHIAKQENLGNIERFSDLSSWTNINERPLSFFSLSLNYSIHELDVFGYHLFNLIIHIVAGIFVFLLTLLILKSPFNAAPFVKGKENVMALLVALIFIAHPLQTQSVTYIIQRMTSMASMFYLGAVYFYLYGRYEYVKHRSKLKPIVFYSLSFLMAIAALLSKQIAASIPLAILLVEFFFVRSLDGKMYKKYLFFVAGIILSFAIAIIAFGMLPRETESISRADYLITQFRVIVKYVQLLILPISQNLDYDFSISNSIWGVKEISSLLFNLLLVFLAFRFYKKHKILSFGIIWIFISLIIESSIIPIQDVIFEHRLYLSIFGFAFILVYLSFKFLPNKRRDYPLILLTLLICIYAVLAFSRNTIWQSKLSLWSDVVKKSPDKARPHLNLGNAYFHSNNHQMALRHFNRAINIEPSNWQGYFNRAQVAAYLNKPKAAINDFTQSINLNNDFAESYDSRGISKIQIKDIKGAIDDFNKAITLAPTLESAWFNRANAKIYSGDFTAAMSDYNQSIELHPQFAEAYNNRGQLKLNLKKYGEAISDLNQAILINPQFTGAYNNRAKANMALNNLDVAIDDLSKSISIESGNSFAFRNRALCYYRQSDFERAYDDFLKAAKLGDDISLKFVNQMKD